MSRASGHHQEGGWMSACVPYCRVRCTTDIGFAHEAEHQEQPCHWCAYGRTLRLSLCPVWVGSERTVYVRFPRSSPGSGPAENPEEFRSPRGVRKSWMNEPAGWRAGLWGFGLGVAPSGAATAGKPRRWRAWKSPDWRGLSAWRSEPGFDDRGCTAHPEVRHRVRHAPRRGSSGDGRRQAMPAHGEPAGCDVERNGGPRG